MGVAILVETEDLVAAAQSLSRTGDRIFAGVAGAVSDAASCTGMAGDDPSGLAWAGVYEQCATRATDAAQDAINGAYVLASLLGATATNYANADSASTVGVRHAVDDVIAGLPVAETVSLADRFSGVGGGPPNAPYGWSHVEHYLRKIWPNGHQDRLHRAAAAWHHSADTLRSHAWDVEAVPYGFGYDRLPERDDITTACDSLATHLRDVATAHDTLGHGCEDLAHHLDVAHSALEWAVTEFLAQTVSIEIVGNALSAVTAGLGEVPTQIVEGDRVAAIIERIGALLLEFETAVDGIISELPTVAALADRVSTALDRLLSIRIVVAETTGVGGLRVLSIVNEGRDATQAARLGGEVGAVARLEQDATLPAELRSALESPRSGEWNDPATLEKHYSKHASDFGVTSESAYIEKASAFLRRGIADGLPTKIDAEGNIRIYDPATNTFGSYTADGTVRTFFKPSSPTYWTRQRGAPVR